MSEEPLQPARQPSPRPQAGEEEIRGSTWMVAQQIVHTAADVGGIVGGVAAAKVMLGGSKSSGDGGGTDAPSPPQGQTPSNDE